MSNNDDEKKSDEPPPGLGAMHSLAVGYGQYVSYLKAGGESGISDIFGKVSLKQSSQRLNAVSQRLNEVSQQLEAQESSQGKDIQKPEDAAVALTQLKAAQSTSITLEDKLGAVFGILSAALSIQDVCQTYGVDETRVRKWLETACRGMEAALSEDNS